jgi:ribosome-binding protein aMBF1 (putative translation factor)
MTLDRWILLAIGVLSAFNIVALRLIAIGRWTQKIDATDDERKASKEPFTLQRLGWEIESIAKDIRELRGMFDSRYAELAAKVTADHQLIREIMNWKAGLLGELTEHFYSIQLIDRMAKESETDRKSLHDRVAHVEDFVTRRTEPRP